jgi:feruloyl-CoA synthase
VPKAVINTHRMLCSNAQMQRQVKAFLREEPPVMVDWLPWNHTAGGNNIFSLVFRNGGTLYIDPGKPDPTHIEATLRLLRRVSPTLYFNVPLGFEALIPHLQSDEALRRTFFRDLKCIWYAAAAMKPSTWESLEALAMAALGKRLLTITALGMTETSPVALFGNLRANGLGVVGVPVPGVELKLIPCDGQFEALYRGPNVTPGYWRDPEATQDAFDKDGYFRSGDLLSFVDERNPEAGLRFEGRATDDFKLDSGTRVAGGALRMLAVAALAPLIADVVVVGPGRGDVRALLFPDWASCARFVSLAADAPRSELINSHVLKRELSRRLAELAESATGNSNRIVAGLLMLEPPSAGDGEVTEKGTINGRFVQRNRAGLVDVLYGASHSDLLVAAAD